MCSMLAEYYPRGADGRMRLPDPAPLPDFMTLRKAKRSGPWVTPIEQWLPSTGTPPFKFSPLEIPPEVQARYDALPEERKAELRAEVEAMIDGLYAKRGITRTKEPNA